MPRASAIEKIQSEMDNNKNNTYIQVVGGFLLQHLAEVPQDAEKINDKDKTIAKSLDEMKTAAGKKRNGSSAVLTDQEGFAVVLKYFGISGGAKAPVATQPVKPVAAPHTKPSVAFDVKLEDLLS